MHLAYYCILSTETRAWHMVDVQYIYLLKGRMNRILRIRYGMTQESTSNGPCMVPQEAHPIVVVAMQATSGVT